MEALKVIGAILGIIVGFALIIGVVIAVGAVGFFLGWLLLALFLFAAFCYGVYTILTSR